MNNHYTIKVISLDEVREVAFAINVEDRERGTDEQLGRYLRGAFISLDRDSDEQTDKTKENE